MSLWSAPARGPAVSVSEWSPSARRADPATVGTALGRLHLALAGFPGELPFMAPARAQIDDGLAALERDHVLDRPATAP